MRSIVKKISFFLKKERNLGLLKKPLISMLSRGVLRKQNDVVISKSSELRLPQLIQSFAMTIKKTFSAILISLSFPNQTPKN